MTDAASTTDHITDPAAAEPTLEEHALTWEAITRAWVIALAALFAHACRDGVVTEAELADAGNV